MTSTTDFSKKQLTTILSALDDAPRSPANKGEALRAIGRSAKRFGLTADDAQELCEPPEMITALQINADATRPAASSIERHGREAHTYPKRSKLRLPAEISHGDRTDSRQPSGTSGHQA
jgi:hypothetical protein